MLTIFLKEAGDVLTTEDWWPSSEVFEERERAEEWMGGKDLSDALLNLFSFGKSQE